jgi:hypothetical protein
MRTGPAPLSKEGAGPAGAVRVVSVRHERPSRPPWSRSTPEDRVQGGGSLVQATLTAVHAAATAAYWLEPAPYRSCAAESVAVRAWL